tara:strand:+ start:18 stop:170 length:153 start_codon:yes stop_codon:yes gene_type:complete
MKIEPLTLYDIQRASSNYLKSVVKNGCVNLEVENVIKEELYRRETRRSIT